MVFIALELLQTAMLHHTATFDQEFQSESEILMPGGSSASDVRWSDPEEND